MKKLLAILAVLLPWTAGVRAQTPPIIGPANIANTLYAANFAGWSVSQGNNGPFSWSSPQVCTSATSGGVTFKPFVVGSPIRINDQATPTHSENVTVTAVNIIGSGCSITTSTPSFQHYSFFLSSATAGLQEAINYSKQSFGTTNPASLVIVTPAFLGTTGTITSAMGTAAIGILDERTPCPVAYGWTGSAYTGINLCSGGGSTTLTLTTEGTSGDSTLTGSPSAGYTLNIPDYSAGSGGCTAIGAAGTLQASDGAGGCESVPANYGITTADWFTLLAPLAIDAPSLPSQIAMTYDSHALTPGSSTTAVSGVDASGHAIVSAAGQTASRFCDEAGLNGVCTSTSAGLEPLVSAPISGQYVVVYPTIGMNTSNPTGEVTGTTSGWLRWGCTNSLGLCTVLVPDAETQWGGFILPSYINPANVTAVYLDAVTSAAPFNGQMPTGGANRTAFGCTPGSINSLLTGNTFAPATPYATQEITLSSSLTGTTLGTTTCFLHIGASTAIASGATITVSAIRLIVYYTGTAPPPDNNVYIVPPLQYVPATQELLADPNASFHGLDLLATTVSSLPINPIADLMQLVQDGVSKTDCGSGGGANLVLCYWNGSGWSAFANGTSAQLSSMLNGIPANSQILYFVPQTVALTLPSACAGSLFHAQVAATSSAVWTLTDIHSGTPTTICTATFAASATSATFSGSGGLIPVGDDLELVGPSTADATLSGLGVSLYANK